MAIKKTGYGFQKWDRWSRAGDDAGSFKDLELFASKLELSRENGTWPPTREYEPFFYDFVHAIHRNILWYTIKRRWEVLKLVSYMLISAILVLAIPLIVALIPMLPEIMQTGTRFMPNFISEAAKIAQSSPAFSSGTVISAQLTAMVTGIYGLHRIISSWIFRRNSAHSFWKAGSDLKTLLYSLEDEWKGRTRVGNVWDPSFFKALEEVERQAWEIVKVERGSFFQSFSKTQVDLQGLITQSMTSATTLVTQLAKPSLKEIDGQNLKKAKVKADLQKSHVGLVSLLTKKRLLEKTLGRTQAQLKMVKDPIQKLQLANNEKAAKKLLGDLGFDIIEKEAEHAGNKLKAEKV